MTDTRQVRQCKEHRGAELLLKNGALYCPFNHYPVGYLVVGEDGTATPATEEPHDEDERARWRAAAGTGTGFLPRRPAPARQPEPPKPILDEGEVKAPPPPTKGESTMPVPKCSRCGGNGHNVRTCKSPATVALASAKPRRRRASRPAAAADPPPEPALAISSTLIAAATRPALEHAREQLSAQLDELDQAINTFHLVEKVIPKPFVNAARAVLEAAGASFERTDGTARQRVALNVAVAGVAAAFYAATPPKRPRRADILYAAASAISGLIRKES